MRAQKILYHHRTQGRGAEGNHIVSIVSALRALGHHVDVLSPPGVDPFDPATTIPADKDTIGETGWAYVWQGVSGRLPNWLFEIAELLYNVPAYLRVRAALKTGSYDFVFERYAFYLFGGMLAAKHSRVPYVLEVNEVSGVPDRVRRQVFFGICSKIEFWIVQNCCLAHVVSSYLHDALTAAKLPTSKIVIAPNGFDAGKVQINRARKEIRSQLKIDDNIVIGFAGWFVTWDRLDFLADVFITVRRERPNVRLCLVGDGDVTREFRDKAIADGWIDDLIFTGPVPRSEVSDYIQAFDIGILPHSNPFGSPMIMFEMMGLGVPLVAPRLPPIEDVHRDGDTALLFNPLHLQECVLQILRLVDSMELRRSISDRALDKLQTEHTWRATAERILDGLSSIYRSSAGPDNLEPGMNQ